MSDRVRLDVWLDVACIARTRSQAKELCDGGKVEVGGAHAKAEDGKRTVVVTAIAVAGVTQVTVEYGAGAGAAE